MVKIQSSLNNDIRNKIPLHLLYIKLIFNFYSGYQLTQAVLCYLLYNVYAFLRIFWGGDEGRTSPDVTALQL